MLQYTQNRAAEQQSLLMLWNLSYSSRKTADNVVTLNDVLFQNSLLVWSLQLHPGLQSYSQHCHSQSLHCRPLASRSTSNLFDLTTAVCDMTVLPVESSLLACCVVSNANLACVWLGRRLEAKRQISIYILSILVRSLQTPFVAASGQRNPDVEQSEVLHLHSSQ